MSDVRNVGSIKFPLINKWMPGLAIQQPFFSAVGRSISEGPDCINAVDLEAELASGAAMYSFGKNNWISEKIRDYEREALLIGIQPINKKVKREEISEFLNDEEDILMGTKDLLQRILDHGVEG